MSILRKGWDIIFAFLFQILIFKVVQSRMKSFKTLLRNYPMKALLRNFPMVGAFLELFWLLWQSSSMGQKKYSSTNRRKILQKVACLKKILKLNNGQ